MQNWKISVKALSKWLRKLTTVAKRLIAIIIAIIIVSFDNNKWVDYNKNDYNKGVLIASFAISEL